MPTKHQKIPGLIKMAHVISLSDLDSYPGIVRVSLIPYTIYQKNVILLIGNGAGIIADGRLSDFGGTRELNESPSQCLLREVYEETNIVLKLSLLTSSMVILIPVSGVNPEPNYTATVFTRVKNFSFYHKNFRPSNETQSICEIPLSQLLTLPLLAIGRLRYNIEFIKNNINYTRLVQLLSNYTWGYNRYYAL